MRLIAEGRGIYILLINVREDIKIYLKNQKEWIIPRGIYFYVGSAKGPGGLKARINRHFRSEKNIHWHVDYLLSHPASRITHVIYAETEEPECILAPLLESYGYTHVIKGFGSSDCRHKCVSHLLRCSDETGKCLENAVLSFKKIVLSPVVVSISV